MRRSMMFVLALLLLVSGSPALAQSGKEGGRVVVAEVEGVINPMTARYLERILASARDEGAEALVLLLDTPGGLESAMREMVQVMLDAPLPVIVYVSPAGARATSAGMFIALAGHVAAMAPGTHVGAAHPVPLGMEAGEVMDAKLTSDAVALAQSIASIRGRNVDWPARAVRENSSLLAAEAVEANVVDLLAADLDDLLEQVDGREVTVAGARWTLHTAEADRHVMPMRWSERLIHTITHPDIAYLLLTLGTLLLLAELAEPGLGVGGVGAAVSFVLAFLALGSLPLNWAGIALLAVALVMLAVALLTDADIVVTGAALVPFVLGSLMLYAPFRPTSPAAPDLSVSVWLIALMAVAIAGFSLVVLRAIVKASKLPPQSGAERLIGMHGRALTALAPEGEVRVDLEDWSAVSIGGEVQAGQEIWVVGVSGVRLQVAPADTKPQGG
ncbi:MAG: NfeD family protein [Anaerolineae bacterium]